MLREETGRRRSGSGRIGTIRARPISRPPPHEDHTTITPISLSNRRDFGPAIALALIGPVLSSADLAAQGCQFRTGQCCQSLSGGSGLSFSLWRSLTESCVTGAGRAPRRNLPNGPQRSCTLRNIRGADSLVFQRAATRQRGSPTCRASDREECEPFQSGDALVGRLAPRDRRRTDRLRRTRSAATYRLKLLNDTRHDGTRNATTRLASSL